MSIGANCWIISEIWCNEYTKYGPVVWHFLFPLGFYKLVLKYNVEFRTLRYNTSF